MPKDSLGLPFVAGWIENPAAMWLNTGWETLSLAAEG